MATRIDGPGLAKLETLNHAVTLLQRLHAVVEQMASAQRLQQSVVPFKQQVARAATPLASLLKPQFGPIADLVTGLVLLGTRGGTETTRVRGLREAVAQIRMQLEAAETRVRKDHTVDDSKD